ncbi:MAG TPA: PKD domain-containing protein [Saprospiraceae bacterium]|nr:PKD domain-containing protein [Saprospiraceae bacterium]
MQIRIVVSNCIGGGCGLQFALLDNCPWDNSNVLACDPNGPVGDTMAIDHSGLEAGRFYWLVIDGCAGQICDYEFIETKGIASTSHTEIDTTICGDILVFDGIEYPLGTHDIVYQDTTGNRCDSIVTLSVNAQISVVLEEVVICYPQDDTVAIAPIVSGTAGGYTYLWSDGVTDSMRLLVDPEPGDTISVTVTDIQGCSATAQTIVENIVSINILPEIGYMCPDSTFNEPVEVVVTGGEPPYVFEWTVGNDTVPMIPIPLNTPGQYQLTVTDSLGCKAESFFTLIEPQSPVVTIFPQNPVLCTGTSAAGVQIIGLADGSSPFLFEWITSDSIQQEDTILVTEPDSIILKVYDAHGCIGTLDFVVQEFPSPEFDLGDFNLFCPDSLAAGIEIDVEFGADIISFETSGWIGPPFIVNQPGSYSITVTDVNGCTAADTLFIEKLDIPSADFTVGICGLEARFFNRGTGTFSAWDFGDGDTDSVDSPIHVFDSVGIYSVQLTTWNACDSSMITKEVNLLAPDVPSNANCDEAINLGVLPSFDVNCSIPPDSVFFCISGSNANAPSSGLSSPCAGLYDPLVWYVFQTDVLVELLNITLHHDHFPASAIQLFQSVDGTCANLIPIGLTRDGITCLIGTDGKLIANHTPVEPSSIYYLAVSGINTIGGEFELCMNTLNISAVPCVTDVQLEIVSRSVGGPLEGPFFPGEEVEICMKINNFQVSTGTQNCQWFQGIVPVFGNGWDLMSFDTTGQPLNATLNGNPFPAQNLENGGIWNWWNNIQYHHPHCYYNVGYYNGDNWLDMCHGLLDIDCDGSGLEGGCCGPCWGSTAPDEPGSGSPLPPGWFTSGVDGTCGGLTGWPAVDWGDGNTCNGSTGPWEFCFGLSVRSVPVDSLNDLTLGFFTFTDGEVGTWFGNSSVCSNDLPILAKLPACWDDLYYLSDTLAAICSGTGITLNPDIPDADVWKWSNDTPESISGASEGVGKCSDLITDTLINTDLVTAYVNYEFIGFGGPCPILIKNIIVPVLPQLDVDFSSSLTFCTPVDTVVVDAIVTGGSSELMYQWGNGSQDSSIYLIDPMPGEIVSVTVTDLSTGCAGEKVSIIGSSVININVVPSEGVLCPQDPDGPDFSFSIDGGSPPYVIQWTTPEDSVSVNIQPLFNLPGTYQVFVTDAYQCTDTMAFEVVSAQPPSAAFTYEIYSDSVVFTNLSENALSAEWYFGDGNSSVEWDPVHQYQANGEYGVILIVMGACASDTTLLSILITGVAVNDLNPVPEIRIYPNPNEGSFTILSGDIPLDEVRIFDLLGKQIMFEKEESVFQLKEKVAGVNIIVIRVRESTIVQRILIQ